MLLLTLMLVGISYSCNNEIENDIENSFNKQNHSTRVISGDNFPMLSNPYDYIGEMHNEAMEKLALQVKYSVIKSTDQVSNFIDDFMISEIKKDYPQAPVSTLQRQITSTKLKIALHVDSLKTYYAKYAPQILSAPRITCAACPFSITQLTKNAYQKKYLTQMEDAFVSYSDEDILFPLMSMKQRILRDTDQPMGVRAPLLCAISIAKYSKQFWEKYIVSSFKRLSLKNCVYEDFVGAALGVVYINLNGTSSATGLVFGPGGYVLTNAGAAVIGGLAGSGEYLGRTFFGI